MIVFLPLRARIRGLLPVNAVSLCLLLCTPAALAQGGISDCRSGAPAEAWMCNELGSLPEEEADEQSRGELEAETARSLAAQPDSQLDWVDEQNVPEELRDYHCDSCEGRYLDPLADADRDSNPDNADIEANALDSQMQGNTVKLSGGVRIHQGFRQLQSDSATIDRVERTGALEGNITVREPGVLLKGERADFDSVSGRASVEGSEFLLHEQHMRGTASQLRRDEDGFIHIEEGSLSYCAPDNNDWLLAAESMELDLEEGVGTARNATLRIGDVPIFWAPWMSFPLDDRRRTGLLWPSIGSDSKGGVDIASPLYLNLAPNYDALYIPRYIQERGLNHEIDLRYLGRQLGRWSVGGSYLQNDERYENEFPEERSYDRWLVRAKHRGLIDKRWRSEVDYAKASDTNYLKDLDNSSLDTKRATALLQRGALDYLGDNWLVEAEVQQFQSLADDINNDYKKLPQISTQYRGDKQPFSIAPIALAQYSSFNSDDERVTGQRLYAEAGVGYPMQWGFGFLKPVVKYRQLAYDLDYQVVTEKDDKPTTGAAMTSVDGGLYFDRPTRVGDKGMVHTLEPRLFYLYSEYEEQPDNPDFDSAELTFSYGQLFRDTRFGGRDRIDDSNQLSLGLTTRYIGDEDGREYLSASLGQIFYFDDRRVRLNPNGRPIEQSGSELAGELTFSPTKSTSLRTSLLYDPYSGDMNAGYILANYTPEEYTTFNAGYTYRRPTQGIKSLQVTEQMHLSAYVPVYKNWLFFAAVNYSIEANTSVEDMFGLEYDTCCWKVRLMRLRYFDNIPGTNPDFNDPNLEREDSTQIQIVLKGMGGFGSGVAGVLDDMIRGFKEREY